MTDFNNFKKAGEEAFDWLKKEYAGIRTGQANPSILDGVLVEAYGSKMPVNQVSSIVASGPKALLVTPWDTSVSSSIDRAIREANLGVSVAMNSQGIVVSFPDLTSDRRALLIKTIKEKLEEARIRIRSEREKAIGELDRGEKDGSLSKDDKFRLKNELQKLVDAANSKLEEFAERKEKEISE